MEKQNQISDSTNRDDLWQGPGQVSLFVSEDKCMPAVKSIQISAAYLRIINLAHTGARF